MKEIVVEVTVPNATAKSYFEAIYAGSTLRVFHAEINGDDAAQVGSWQDNVRTVQFLLPMNVPAMLKKVIGLEKVPVVETQRLEWSEGGAAFTLESEPLLNFVGANKFVTSGRITARSCADGSAAVAAVMRCSASMPWPMQATVEGLMATEAATSIGQFLDWCVLRHAAHLAEQQQAAAPPEELPAPPAPRPTRAAAAAAGGGAPAGGLRGAMTVGGDVFYDAWEDEEQGGGEEGGEGGAARGAGGGEAVTDVEPYVPPRLEDVIVDCLRSIQAATADTARSVAAMEQLLRNMDENILAVRDKVAGRRRPVAPAAPPAARAAPSASTTAATAARAGSCAAGAAAPVGGRGLLGGSTTLLAVATVCATGAFVYMRYVKAAKAGGGG